MKAVGYIVALVVLGIVIYFVATSGKKAEVQKGQGGAKAQQSPLDINAVPYAGLKKIVSDAQAKVEEDQKKAPPGITVPPLNLGFLSALSMKDAGKVVGEKRQEPGWVTIDVDGDSQPDVKLQFGPMKPVPDDVKQGDQISFAGKVVGGLVQGDHLLVTANVKTYKVGAAQ